VPVNIGGLNVSIGVDASAVTKGIQNALVDINKFKQRLQQTSLEGVIKGDPFKAARDSISGTRRLLDNLNSKLVGFTKNIKMNLGEAVRGAEKNAEEFSQAWNRAIKKLDTPVTRFVDALSSISIQTPGRLPASKKLGTAVFGEIQEQVKSLKRRNISKELREALDMSKILEDFKMTTPEIKKDINMILKAAEKDLQKLAPEIENVAKKLNEAYEAQRKFEIQNLIKQESDLTLALKRRSEKLDEITIKEARLRTEIKQGINVEQNRLELMKSLEQRQKLGVELTEEQIKEYKKLYAASLRLPKFKGIPLEEAKHETQLMIARSVTEAQKRRWAAVRKLQIEEAKLRAELQINMNVEQNRLALYQNLNKQKELGARLTKKQARELASLTKEQKRIQRRGSPFEMFSPAWFKMRLGWFVQLRAYWAAYRGLTDTVRDVIESQKQLARALRTARSEWMSNTEIAEKYMKVMAEAAVTHAADWQQSGEALYQLGSAGLSAEEALAAFNSVMSLAVGTEGDLREVTKSVAGVYNNFNEEMSDALTTQQKFQHIVNVMSTAWAKHQIEISELTDGYKYASAAAKMAGISLEDLTAYLAVANDHMIKGSRAGRAFTTMISRISRTPEKFRRELGLLQKIDITKPLELSNIFKELHQRLVEGKTSVAELSVAFQNLGIRATPIFRVLLENYDEWEKARQEAHDEVIKATELEEKQLNNLGDQIKRLGGLWKKYITQGVKPFTDWLKNQLKTFIDESEIKDMADRIRERFQSEDSQIIITDRQKKVILDRIGIIDREIKRLSADMEESAKLDISGEFVDVNKEGLESLKKEREELVKILEYQGGREFQRGLETIRKQTGKLSIGFRKLTTEQRLDLIKRHKELLKVYGLEEKSKDVNKELARIRKEITEAEIERNKLIQQGLQLALKEGTFGAKYTKIMENAKDAQKRINSLQREYNSKLGEANQKVSEINKKVIGGLKTENKIRQIRIKDIDIEISRMTAGGIVTKEEQKRINELLDERTRLQKEINYNTMLINTINAKQLGINSDIAEQMRRQQDILAENDRLKRKESVADKARRTELKRISKMTQIALIQKERELAYLKESGASEDKILRKKLEIVELNKKDLESSFKLETNDQTRLRLKKQLTDLAGQEVQLHTRLLELQHPFYGAWKELNRNIKDTNSFIKDLTTDTTTQFADSFSDALVQVASGVADTKATFKDFFRSLIMDINRTIAKMLIMQAITGVVKYFATPPAKPATGWEAKAMGAATGGVLPHIEAFRAFSEGGLVNRPTLAVLGDNPSKKEIVIPEENIKSNEVSGYVRDQDKRDILILNLLTQEDIARAMAANPGRNVIINTIGKDLNSLGRTAKAVKSI